MDISYYKLYGLFVCKYLKYPGMEEFIAYLQSRFERKGLVLPRQVEAAVRRVLEDFAKVTEGVAPTTFKDRYTKTLALEDRLLVERQYLNPPK